MPRYGFTLFSELNGPKDLVRQAVQAEQAGFDYLVISDHFHPWLHDHTDSPFAWSVLGAVADRTERVEIGTLVTCPFLRYHPAIVAQAAATIALMSDGRFTLAVGAQAAATIALMSDGRFTLAVGAGERLNEHVVGRGWPPVDVRHEMLEESVEVMRRLWTGGWTTYRGRHVTVEDAKLYTYPETPPDVLVGASGPASCALAGRIGDGVVAIDPDPEVIRRFREAGGEGRRTHGQIPLSFDRDEAKAHEHAMRFRFGVPGWKVMAELPNPVNFEAATQTVRPDDVLQEMPAGPDPEAHAEGVRGFVDAGFDEVSVVQVGDDYDGFFEFWANEVRPLVP